MSFSRTVKDDKIVAGRDGWLFLGNDTNRVIDQVCGRFLFEPREVRAWRRLLENRTAWVEKTGGSYFFVVPPNPHALYPEKLPEGIVSSPERPVTQLLADLERSGSFARVIYPLDELVAAKAEGPVASSNDSHWNAFGGFVAYGRLMDDVEKVAAVRRLGPGDVTFHESPGTGDLGGKLDPPVEAPQVVARIRPRKARLVSDNRVSNRGRILEIECLEAPPTTCVVLGDSFTHAMLIFVAESFRRTVFAQVPTLDQDLIEEERPDVVVSVLNERFLVVIPGDLAAPTAREVAAQKTGEGLADMPHLGPMWGGREEAR